MTFVQPQTGISVERKTGAPSDDIDGLLENDEFVSVNDTSATREVRIGMRGE